MTVYNNNATFGTEVSYDTSTGTGSYAKFSGTIPQNAAIMIFDNQSNVAVSISQDGTNSGKTFAANSGLTIDLRANVGKASDDLTFRVGTQFWASCSAGTGKFYISWIYAS